MQTRSSAAGSSRSNRWVTPAGSAAGRTPYGTAVTLTARPSLNYAFAGWNGPCSSLSTTEVCGIPLFEIVETAPTFNCVGPTCSTPQPLTREVKVYVVVRGSGKVQLNGSWCSRACSTKVKRGKSLVARARGGPGPFLGWSGNACAGRYPRCQFAAFSDFRGNAPVVRADFGS